MRQLLGNSLHRGIFTSSLCSVLLLKVNNSLWLPVLPRPICKLSANNVSFSCMEKARVVVADASKEEEALIAAPDSG